MLDNGPRQVASHLRAALEFVASDAVVRVHPCGPEEGEHFWGVLVLARDRPGLFSTVAGVLTALGHNILQANVYTTRSGVAMEIYQVDPIPGGAAEEALEVERIEARLVAVLAGDRPAPSAPVRRQELGPRAAPPSVRITNQDSDFYSIIDIATNDRPALLHDITRALHSLGLEISMSRAATRANRVTDAFYVTDDGHKILDPERRGEIETRVLEAIDRDPG
jgi:[protein-PII] uridylyltransferase